VEEFWQYAGVLIALLASAFGAPIPEELPVATGGVLVGKAWQNPEEGPRWWIMLPTCILGVVLCDSLLYLIGRRWGHWLMTKKWVQRHILPPEKYRKIEKNFENYGVGILLIARVLPGIRTAVFLTAGIIRMPFRKFLFADGLYAIPGVSFIFFLAYWFTDQFMEVLHKVESYRPLVVTAVISGIAGALIYSFLRRPVSTGDPTDIPVIGNKVAQVAHQFYGHKSNQPITSSPSISVNSDFPPVQVVSMPPISVPGDVPPPTE
jgi:membrane protein DedA with SNARE-associated domain